jgi:hypothetical protein
MGFGASAIMKGRSLWPWYGKSCSRKLMEGPVAVAKRMAQKVTFQLTLADFSHIILVV